MTGTTDGGGSQSGADSGVDAGGAGGGGGAVDAGRHNAFIDGGSLATARVGPTATLLPNGEVLIAGGIGPTGTQLVTAELYIPGAVGQGSFTSTGSMGSYHQGAAVLLPSGKVFFPGPSLSEFYEPAVDGGIFSPAGRLLIPRIGFTATLLQNGKVLIAGGGQGSVQAELYDPGTDGGIGSYALTGSLTTNRVGATATLLNNGRVLVVGGTSPSSQLSSAELYDPATGTFTQTASLNTARSNATATLLSDGKVLIAGGRLDAAQLRSAEVFDPAGDGGVGTFTYARTAMTGNRGAHTATRLSNGTVILIGGYGAGLTAASSSEIYDHDAGSFSNQAFMLSARGNSTATLLNNGTILVAGGSGDSMIPIAAAELYFP
jgi:hypothetical protein